MYDMKFSELICFLKQKNILIDLTTSILKTFFILQDFTTHLINLILSQSTNA